MILYGRQDINQADIDAVVAVLKSDYLTQGSVVPAFEAEMAKKVDAKYAVAVNSATSALHLACQVLGLTEGDWLWTSPNTFVASANCALFCGAKIDFVDIDSRTYNMSVEALALKLQEAELLGKLPKIVIPVHFAGQSCDMQKIKQLSEQYGFKIIEDAAHAIGGEYQQAKIGCCQYSDITVFSFHPVKIITTGEGGVLVTQNAEYYQNMKLFRSHGVTRDSTLMTHPSEGDWYYQQVALGYNYRMTEMQAALGVSQLQRLDEFVQKRHEIATLYHQQLAALPLEIPFLLPELKSAWHLYVIQLIPVLIKKRRQIFDQLRSIGVGVHVHYIPVHTQPYYQALGFQSGDFPKAEKYYSAALSIPLHAGLTGQEQETIIHSLKTILLGQYNATN